MPMQAQLQQMRTDLWPTPITGLHLARFGALQAFFEGTWSNSMHFGSITGAIPVIHIRTAQDLLPTLAQQLLQPHAASLNWQDMLSKSEDTALALPPTMDAWPHSALDTPQQCYVAARGALVQWIRVLRSQTNAVHDNFCVFLIYLAKSCFGLLAMLQYVEDLVLYRREYSVTRWPRPGPPVVHRASLAVGRHLMAHTTSLTRQRLEHFATFAQTSSFFPRACWQRIWLGWEESRLWQQYSPQQPALFSRHHIPRQNWVLAKLLQVPPPWWPDFATHITWCMSTYRPRGVRRRLAIIRTGLQIARSSGRFDLDLALTLCRLRNSAVYWHYYDAMDLVGFDEAEQGVERGPFPCNVPRLLNEHFFLHQEVETAFGDSVASQQRDPTAEQVVHRPVSLDGAALVTPSLRAQTSTGQLTSLHYWLARERTRTRNLVDGCPSP